MVTQADDSIGLLTLVESLQSNLTNEKAPEIRCEALDKIMKHIVRFGSSYSTQENHVLCEFLSSKLTSDSIQVIPSVLQCCFTLFSTSLKSSSQNLDLKDVVRVLKTSLDELYVQSFSQSTRLLSYKLVIVTIKVISSENSRFESQKEETIKLAGGAEHVVLQAIRMVDGEKDPRNLLSSFHLIQLIASWPVLQPTLYLLGEELFEVFSCYFPIEFVDSSDADSIGVTKADLVSALLGCFTATPLFAEHAIPFLLDKLSAEVIQCKVDTFEALTQSAKVYLACQNEMKFEEYSQQMWFGMFSELTTSGNELVIRACYSFFEKLLQTVFSKALSEDSVKKFMVEVLNDTKGHFRNVGTKTHRLTLVLLLKCISYSVTYEHLQFFADDVIAYSVNAALESSHQLNKWLPPTNILLQALTSQESSTLQLSQDLKAALNRLSFSLLESFQSLSAKEGTDERCKDCLVGLSHLSKLDFVWSDGQFPLFWTVLTTSFWNESRSSSQFCDLYLELFESLLNHCSPDSLAVAFHQVIHQKQRSDEDSNLAKDRHDFLYTLLLLSFPGQFLVSNEVGLNKLVSCVRKACFGNNETASDRNKLLSSLTSFCKKQSKATLAHLTEEFLSSLNKIDSESHENRDDSQLVLTTLINSLSAASLEHQMSILSTSMKNGEDKLWTRTVYCCFCLAADEDLIIKHKHLDVLLSRPDEFALTIAYIVNYFEDLSPFQDYLSKLSTSEELVNESNCYAFLMTCHALVRRGNLSHPITKELIGRYLSLLGNKNTGNYLASNVSILVHGFKDKSLSDKIKTRTMFVQQLVCFLMPQLLDLGKIESQTSEYARANWILCLMCLLQCLPDTLKVSSFAKDKTNGDLMRIVLTALHATKSAVSDSDQTFVSNNQVLNSALILLNSAMLYNDEDSIRKIHEELLKICVGGSDVQVRVNSLKCLTKLGTDQAQCRSWLDSEKRRKTKRAIEVCLDDKKRVVRREAVSAKTAWEKFA